MFFSAEMLLPNVRIILDPLLGTFGPSNNLGWTLRIDERTIFIVGS